MAFLPPSAGPLITPTSATSTQKRGKLRASSRCRTGTASTASPAPTSATMTTRRGPNRSRSGPEAALATT